jgi:hypothetical protein
MAPRTAAASASSSCAPAPAQCVARHGDIRERGGAGPRSPGSSRGPCRQSARRRHPMPPQSPPRSRAPGPGSTSQSPEIPARWPG